jgi:hypothetical protein
VGYYDYEADKDFNGPFEVPTCGSDGRFFWIEQVFPSDKTFPDGFRYAFVGLVSDLDAKVETQELQKGLGTRQAMPRDSLGNLILPVKSVGHDDLYIRLEWSFSLVRDAVGVAGTATLSQAGTGSATVYTSVVTINEEENYLQKAKDMLLEAEKLGYEGLRQENKDWYDALYDSRENGRIFIQGDKQEEAEEKLLADAFLSWSYGHGGYCRPNPSKNEGSASYAAFDVDTQAWHSLPCYNELFTEGPWFVRNRSEVMLQWPQLIWHWRKALQEKAKIIYSLPGLVMGHGYLPPTTPDPRYIENQSLDFCMEVPGQVLKVIWNLWDYTGDEAYLKDTAYPLLADLAIFYEAFARLGWDGKVYHIEPTVETESYGISYRNEFAKDTTGAIAMFRFVLNTAAQTARKLGRDLEKIAGWEEVAAHLPEYPTFEVGSGPILAGNPGIIPRWSAGDHEINSANYPATLADEITLDSPKEQKDIIIRTADTVRNNHNTEPYVLMGAFKDYTVCGYNKSPVKIDNASLLCDELLAAPERLLNSRSGRIHLFPVVPEKSIVAFQGFRTRGGFFVDAAKDETGVTEVVIRSARTGTCHVANPWPGSEVRVENATDASQVADTMSFSAIVGRTYTLIAK